MLTPSITSPDIQERAVLGTGIQVPALHKVQCCKLPGPRRATVVSALRTKRPGAHFLVGFGSSTALLIPRLLTSAVLRPAPHLIYSVPCVSPDEPAHIPHHTPHTTHDANTEYYPTLPTGLVPGAKPTRKGPGTALKQCTNSVGCTCAPARSTSPGILRPPSCGPLVLVNRFATPSGRRPQQPPPLPTTHAPPMPVQPLPPLLPPCSPPLPYPPARPCTPM